MTQQYTNTQGIPLSIAVFLATDNYDHDDDPTHISATTLIKPVRQIILGARVPEGQVTDLGSMMASRTGTAVHEGIERAWRNNYKEAMVSLGYPDHVIEAIRINPTPMELAMDPTIIPVHMEQRLTKRVGKWLVTGKFDFVGQGRLEDFKNASSYVYMKGINDEKFRMQGSLYRWMDPELIIEDHMAIQFIISDWSSMQAKQDPNYPQQRLVQRLLELKPVQETDHYVKDKLAQLELFWDAPESDIPQCSEDELQRSADVYKYYKNGDTTAARSTKNFDSRAEAVIYMSDAGKGQGAIKTVKGQVTACRFCHAFAVCSQKDELIKTGEFSL